MENAGRPGRPNGGHANRRVRRHRRHRLLEDRRAVRQLLPAHRRPHGHGQRTIDRGQSALLHFRSARPECGGRHGLQQLVASGPLCRRELAPRRVGRGAGGRREHDSHARDDDRLLEGTDALARRQVPPLRRRRQRLRPRRRLWLGALEAACRRRARRRQRAGRGARDERQSGRPHLGHQRSQQPIANCLHSRGPAAGRAHARRRRLHRSARHGNAAGRSDRNAGAGRGFPRGGCCCPSLPRVEREGERRTHGDRLRRGRPDQSRVDDRTRIDRVAGAFRDTQSTYQPLGHAIGGSDRRHALAACKQAANRRRQLVRLRRHEHASDR